MMKNLKKALSLALTLALSLALAAPAFAVDPGWSLGVTGKTVSEFVMPSSVTFEQRSWELSENSYRKSEDTWTAEWDTVVDLKAEDTMVLTISKPGTVSIKAWSDPDKDGVYDQWMYEAVLSMGNISYELLPLTTAEPISVTYYEGWNVYTYDNECRLTTDGRLGWTGEQETAKHQNDSDSPQDWEEVAVSADYLIQLFGSDTYLEITTYLRPTLANYGHYYVHLSGESKLAASSGISVTVDGRTVAWTDAVPFIDANSRTMVPLRAVADAMHLDVYWEADTREAVFMYGGRSIAFPIDSTSAKTSDGIDVQMDTAAVIANERTYAPIRYLAEYFGYTVGWDGATQTVSLTK